MLRITDEAFKRMLEERNNLAIKCATLDNTIQQCRHHKRADISLDELHLLEEQYSAMIKYLEVLNIRINRVEETCNAEN